MSGHLRWSPRPSTDSASAGPGLSPGQVVYALVDGQKQCVGCSWRNNEDVAESGPAYPRTLLQWPPIPTSAACRASRRLLEAGTDRWLHPAEIERLDAVSSMRALSVCSYCDPVLFTALRQRHWRLLRLALARGALPTPEDLCLEPGIPPSAAAESVMKAAEAVTGSVQKASSSNCTDAVPNDEVISSQGMQQRHSVPHQQHTAPLAIQSSSAPTSGFERSSFPTTTTTAPLHLPLASSNPWRGQRHYQEDALQAICSADHSGAESAVSTPIVDAPWDRGLDESPRSILSPDLALCPCGARGTRSLLPIFHVALSRYGDKEFHRLLRDSPLPDHMLREVRCWIMSLESGVVAAPTSQLYVSNACAQCFDLLRQVLCLSTDSLTTLPADLLQQSRLQNWVQPTPSGAPAQIRRPQSIESVLSGAGPEHHRFSPPVQFMSALPASNAAAMESSTNWQRAAPERTALELQPQMQNERGAPMLLRMRCGPILKSYRVWSERSLRRMFRRFLESELRLDPSRSVVRYRRWDARYVDRLPPIVSDYARHPHCREVFDWDTPATLQLQNYDLIDCEIVEAGPLPRESAFENNNCGSRGVPRRQSAS
jgi:hypothetical protein